jgi:two-component system CheB/CheR fusion protein
VEADPAQVQQVVMNLVINAAEAIPERAPGAVKIAVTRRALTPEDHRDAVIPIESMAAEWVALSVTDTGSGMDAATQSRMFDPFFTTKFEGRGLGLSAVLGIVKGHQGTLTVRTAPGKGTTFTVLLPASEGKVASPTTPAVAAVPGFGVILVVDDEVSVRTMATRALEIQGYSVLAAENGQQGIEMLAAHPEVRAVVLDLAMPVMSGETALSMMRAERPGLPVILSSGYSENEAMVRFGRDTANGFLQKPYRAETLLAKVAQALEGR